MKCKGCNTIIEGSLAFCTNCGTPIDSKKNPLSLFQSPVSTVIANRYEVVEEVGKGGMGRVYKAWDREHQKYVAIKIIRPEYADDEVMLDRFKKEMLLTQNIHSDNVVKIHSFQVIDDINFIVMNYIDGESLGQVLDTAGALDLDSVISISTQILKGLKAAHKETIIHRDLKPPNIMIDRMGRVSITDFGLARKRDASRVTTTSSLLGTPQYIAPEQWLGDKPDGRTDIYAFGIILFEMIYGKLPFKSSTDYGYMDLHLHTPVVFPKGSGAKVPDYLKTIILKCLEKKPARRYSSVEQILEELKERKVSGSFTTRVRNRAKRTPKYLWISVLVLTILSSAFIFIRSTQQTQKKKKKLTMAILKFSDMTDNQELKFLSSGVPDLLTTDLSQSRHFYVLPHERVFKNLIDTGNIDTTEFPPETLKKLATLCGVNYLITGSITSSGDDIRVSILLNDGETGEFITGAVEECKGLKNIYEVIDHLTWQVKKRIGITPSQLAHDPDLRVASITTENIRALTHFIKGRQLFHLKKYPESAKELKIAIELDEGYAMAYDLLMFSMAHQGKMGDYRRYLLKLHETSKRLSEKDQLRIEALKIYTIDNNFPLAEQKWLETLEKYPFDIETKIYLASTYLLRGIFEKSQKLYEELIYDINTPLIHEGLINLHILQGKIEALSKQIKESEKYFDAEWLTNYKWQASILSRKFDVAENIVRGSDKLSPQNRVLKFTITDQLNSRFEKALGHYKAEPLLKSNRLKYRMRAAVHLSMGQIKKSKNILNEGIQTFIHEGDTYSRIDLLLYLAYLELESQNHDEANKICIDIFKLNQNIHNSYDKRIVLFIYGLCTIESINRDKALALITELSNFKKSTSFLSRIYSGILNSMLNKNFKKFSQFLNLYPKEYAYYNLHALFMDKLLQMQLNQNRINEALKICADIQNLSLGRVMYGNIYALSFYHQGKILMDREDKSEALKAFKSFLKLWKNGDRDIFPQIEDAEKRLKILNN